MTEPIEEKEKPLETLACGCSAGVPHEPYCDVGRYLDEQRALRSVQPPLGALEKAYIRGAKEGRAETRRKLETQLAKYNELVIRYKAAKGEIARLKLASKVKNG